MWDLKYKVIPVILSSALKFILGPLEGYGLRLHFITTVIATISGMMLSVVAFTFFGDWLRHVLLKRFFHKKDADEVEDPNKKKNRIARFIAKYGLGGVAFLTPVFLTPIGGTIIAVGLGKPRRKILLFMLISAVFWAFVFTGIVYLLGRLAVPEILK
jgi:membrane protein DedA with SNARE-associated domain